MIVFDLVCYCGYTFEGWFNDRQDFECQQTASFLVCPRCNSREIRKILSPVRTHTTQKDVDTTDKLSPDSNSDFMHEVEKSLEETKLRLESDIFSSL